MPIPGTTKRERLEENLGVVNVELTSNDLRVIDDACAGIEIHGECYNAASQAMIER